MITAMQTPIMITELLEFPGNPECAICGEFATHVGVIAIDEESDSMVWHYLICPACMAKKDTLEQVEAIAQRAMTNPAIH